jgi:hypothetical protein
VKQYNKRGKMKLLSTAFTFVLVLVVGSIVLNNIHYQLLLSEPSYTKAILSFNTFADPDTRAGSAKYVRWPAGPHGAAILRDGAEEDFNLQDHAAIAEYEERMKTFVPACAKGKRPINGHCH